MKNWDSNLKQWRDSSGKFTIDGSILKNREDMKESLFDDVFTMSDLK